MLDGRLLGGGGHVGELAAVGVLEGFLLFVRGKGVGVQILTFMSTNAHRPLFPVNKCTPTPFPPFPPPGIAHPTKSKIEFGCMGKDGFFDDLKIWNADPSRAK